MPGETVLQAVNGSWRTECKEVDGVDPRPSSKPKGKMADSPGRSRKKSRQIRAVG